MKRNDLCLICGKRYEHHWSDYCNVAKTKLGKFKEVEEIKTKYEVVKSFTPYDFMQARLEAHGDCNDGEFQSDYMFLCSIAKVKNPWFPVDEKMLLAELDNHPCMKKHMLNKYNMIREVKEPERVYHVGQRFNCNVSCLQGKIYKLIKVGNNQIVLYCAEFDSSYNSKSHIVNDPHKITPAEFSEICGGRPKEFELVKKITGS